MVGNHSKGEFLVLYAQVARRNDANTPIFSGAIALGGATDLTVSFDRPVSIDAVELNTITAYSDAGLQTAVAINAISATKTSPTDVLIDFDGAVATVVAVDFGGFSGIRPNGPSSYGIV